MTATRKFAAAALVMLATLAAPAALRAQVSDYRQIKTPALHTINIPQPKRIQLANGMVIFLEEDHELPLIRGGATIRGGARDVPAGKVGLVGIYGAAWRTGGTESKTGDQLDDFLEARAAKVETSGDVDSTAIHFDVLKGDFDAVFPIFVELLRKPAFRQDKIDLAKTQVTTNISRRNDDPGEIADREASKLGYGPDSPYARVPEYATVAAVTREDLVAFHDKFVHPNNIILGVVGDFDSAAMEKKLRDAFGSWPKGPQATTQQIDAHPAKAGVYFVPKDDVTQTTVSLVGPGTTRKNPDYYALQVMNEVVGGGFSGRLMNDIRTKRGLAYGVGGAVGFGWDHPALFSSDMATKSGSTVEAISALKADLTALGTEPFTPDELSQAKETLLNSFVFSVDSKEKALNQRMRLEFYGYPADWYQKYPAGIQAVTTADVARVAKQYVHANELAVLVVGREKDFDKPLSSLGEVTKVDITIPEPGASPSAKPQAAATGNAEGVALAKKVKAFVGGPKVDAIQSVRMVGSATIKTPGGMMDAAVDQLTKYPDTQRTMMKLPMGELTMVLTPEVGFMSMAGMGTQDMPGSQKEGMRTELKQDLLTVLRNIDKPGYTFTAGGTEKVGGVDARVLEISAAGGSLKWFVDPASGKVLRKSVMSRNPSMPGEQITDYTEWKTFDGVSLPVAFTTTVGGEKTAGGTMTQVEINPAVDPKQFEKPAAK